MKTFKFTSAAAFLFLVLFQVGAASADSAVQSDIQKYTQYFKTDFGMNVSVLSSNKESVRQLEKLDLFLEKKLNLSEKALFNLECTQPVCGGGE